MSAFQLGIDVKTILENAKFLSKVGNIENGWYWLLEKVENMKKLYVLEAEIARRIQIK